MTLIEAAANMGKGVTITLRTGKAISGTLVGYDTIDDNEETPGEGREDVLIDFGEWAEAVYVDEIDRIEPYSGTKPVYYH